MLTAWEREDTESSSSEDNVFGMMRRIGQAKGRSPPSCAASWPANVGKVVFFAKHVDVMDAAEDVFTRRGPPGARRPEQKQYLVVPPGEAFSSRIA